MNAFWHLDWFKRDGGRLNFKAERQFNQRYDLLQRNRRSRAHKTEIADFHKPGGQNMLKKSADKLHYVKGHGPPTPAAWFFVFEKYGTIFYRYYTAI